LPISSETTEDAPVIAHWGFGLGCWCFALILFLISFSGCVGEDEQDEQTSV